MSTVPQPVPDGMVPLVGFEVFARPPGSRPPEAVRLIVDCAAHPAAEAALVDQDRDAPPRLTVGVQPRAGGNGAVVLRQFGRAGTVAVALDPAGNADALDALARTGLVQMVTTADPASGWVMSLDRAEFRTVVARARDNG